MVGLDGLEPSTSALSEQRSNHLSYKPKIYIKYPLNSKVKKIKVNIIF